MEKRITNCSRLEHILKLFCLTAFVIFSNNLYAQPSISLKAVITSNINAPMQFVNAGDGTGRMFVAERAGVIKVFTNDIGQAQYTYQGVFHNLSSLVGTSGEGGLLSIVFHPDFETDGAHKGEFFAFYTDVSTVPNSDLIVRRFKATDPLANTAEVLSSQEILRIPHPDHSNHNGGEMHFGSDGLLYLSVGDGGSGGNNAQKTAPTSATDKSYLLGKILRIDVNNISEGRLYAIPVTNPFGNEVFDYGLRNPFRWSFDRQTGDMWIGDVGQNSWEEIDFRPATTDPGVNYGWNCFEGEATYPGTSGLCGTFTNFRPAHVYDGQSVIGGVFYRGTNPLLAGSYIGADYLSGNIQILSRSTDPEATNPWITETRSNLLPGIANFGLSDIGESESGEIHITALNGSVYLVETTALPVTLVTFKAIKTAEGARLKWETSSEKNFSRFEVESGNNQKNFQKIGIVYPTDVIGDGKYQYTHTGPLSENMYYRLKMIDLDNTFEYSRIVSLQNSEMTSGFFVQPSLINSGSMEINVDGNYQSFELVGANGSLLYEQNIAGKKGHLSIPVNKMTSGMYIVRLIGNEEIKLQKVLILN